MPRDPDSRPRIFSPEDMERVVAALTDRGVTGNCPVCTFGQRLLNDGFLTMNVSRNIADAMLLTGMKDVFPCVSLVCQKCGYTTLHNVFKLGLGDLFDGGMT
jgi:uncharacterized protein (DUF2225 family)